MIDLEFYGGGQKEKEAREAWRAYLDHLNTQFDNNSQAEWLRRQTEMFVELMYKMSICLGLEMDKTQIKNSVYLPVAHGTVEQDMNEIRSGFAKSLSGKAAFPIIAQTSDTEAEEQAELRKLVKAYLTDATPCSVRIVTEPATNGNEAANVK